MRPVWLELEGGGVIDLILKFEDWYFDFALSPAGEIVTTVGVAFYLAVGLMWIGGLT